jgi:hypothetical protein
MSNKCYSKNGEDYRLDDISEFIENNELVLGDTIYIADAEYPLPSNFFDAETVIDQAKDAAYDDGGDYAEDFLENISTDAIAELNSFLHEWANKYAKVTWFIAQNVVERKITQEDLDNVI